MSVNSLAQHSSASTEAPRASARYALQVACSIALILAFAFLFLWQTNAAFIEQWTSEQNETYTHGSLITAIGFWLIFRNRETYARERTEFSALGLVAVLLIGLAWLIAVRAGIRTVHELLFPIVAWFGVYAAMGRRMAIACYFPFAFLYFQTIAWDVVSPILQHITVIASDVLLSISSITAFVEGNLIHLPSGTFEVAGGCSGLHFFIVATALAALYGELEEANFLTRVWLVVVAMILAMLSNWIRVFVIVVAGYLTNMQHYLVTVEHFWFGWFVFAITMAGYFVIARRLTRVPAASTQTLVRPSSQQAPRNGWVVGTAVAVAAIGTAPLLNLSSPVRAAASTAGAPDVSSVPGWSGPLPTSAAAPTFHEADRVQSALYERDGTNVEMHVISYLLQTQGKELANYRNSVLRPEEQVVASAPSAQGAATEMTVEDPRGAHSLIQVGYVVGSVRTANPVIAQVYYGLRSLVSPVASHAVVLRAACNASDCSEARASLNSFALSRTESPRT